VTLCLRSVSVTELLAWFITLKVNMQKMLNSVKELCNLIHTLCPCVAEPHHFVAARLWAGEILRLRLLFRSLYIVKSLKNGTFWCGSGVSSNKRNDTAPCGSGSATLLCPRLNITLQLLGHVNPLSYCIEARRTWKSSTCGGTVERVENKHRWT
jgi:hypothetical protein